MSKPTLYQLKLLINDRLSMVDVLNKVNPEGYYQAGQPCFCPFHENSNTPSATIYDNEGITSLYCFAEQRQYRPTDAIEILLDKDVYVVGEKLWNSLSQLEQEQFLRENVSIEDSFSTTQVKPIDKKVQQAKTAFKYGKITAHELLEKYKT